MKKIQLSQGKAALVDDEDYEFLSRWKWHYGVGGYACRSQYFGMMNGKPKKKLILMHRVVNKTFVDDQTDHINGDRLDNRRLNLRTVNQSQNNMNQKPLAGKSSIYKGVSFFKRDETWEAHIKKDGRKRHIGYYSSEKTAARAYNIMAHQLFGDYARPNVI